jgi:hypothetical protein
MASPRDRRNLTDDDGCAAKIAAQGEAGLDAARSTELLDAIPGAWLRTQEGLAQADGGEGVPLKELS